MTDDNSYDKDLVSVLAHDLRTPINSVRGFIEVAIYSGDLTERQRQMLEKAMSALEGMDGLITEVLDMAQVDSDTPLELTPTNLRWIVGESVQMLEGAAENKSVTVDWEVDEDFPTFLAETHRIRQVVNNLLSNALKYNVDGGNVRVTAAHKTDTVELIVEDTGIGISEEDLPHIFERFYRARAGKRLRIKGSGLGLSIVKAIVERHDGSIEVTSKEDEGTTFRVALPNRQKT